LLSHDMRVNAFAPYFHAFRAVHVCAILCALTSCLLAADPVVSNISAVQRAGTKLVDITYDVTADTPTVKVTLEISNDGGQTFTVPAVTTSGALGSGIATGTGKVITWNAGVDWNGRPSSQLRFKVVADDLQVPGFALIPAGVFTMGRTSGDTDSNAPPVNVTVSQFYLGKNEVTKAEWDVVRTWAVANSYTDLATGAGKASNHPVQTVSWWDVIKWCNAKSQKEGLTPCYTVSGSVMKTGRTAPEMNWTANGYRLPTEAEWEKAARGGVSGKRFPSGTDTISHSQANYNASTFYSYDASNNYHPTYNDGNTPYTSPVGSFAANGYGLHDMAGNVWEWCWDWYGASTYVNGATDPRGAVSGTARVIRGGSWYVSAILCRAAYRDYGPPSHLNDGFGFRVARSSVP
jgi:formylglycine-generating enzyme required for sulfatase activity